MNIFSAQTIRAYSERLCELFGFAVVETIQILHEGYKACNLIIRADGKKYFLKVYRRPGDVVYQIKEAEQFFSERDVPVIRSLQDKYGRDAFCLGNEWCSLFPFVDDLSLSSNELTDTHLDALGTLTGRMHAIGAQAPFSHFEAIYFWQTRYFFWQHQELVDTFRKKGELDETEQLMVKTLEEKRRLVTAQIVETSDLPSMNPVLIHGDLIYQNVFWNTSAQLTRVFDFEKTCIAPRAYELARAMMINCFDEAWGDEQFRRASVFLDAYRSEIDLSFEEFLQGVRMYWANVAHLTWLESKYAGGNRTEPPAVYAFHANRIRHLSEDPEAFCWRIYSNK